MNVVVDVASPVVPAAGCIMVPPPIMPPDMLPMVIVLVPILPFITKRNIKRTIVVREGFLKRDHSLHNSCDDIMNCMQPIRSMLSRRTLVRKTLFYIILSALLLLGCAPKSLAPEVLSKGVRFSFYAPSAASVSVAGSFNRWDPRISALAGPDKDGVWAIVLPLPPGRYEYRFVVNGKDWVLDPFSPSVDDGFGERNSVIVLPQDTER